MPRMTSEPKRGQGTQNEESKRDWRKGVQQCGKILFPICNDIAKKKEGLKDGGL